MRRDEKMLYDTLKLNFKILEVNWASLEQNPPNKEVIEQTLKNINNIIISWDKNNFIFNNYYQNTKIKKMENKYATYP